MTFKEYHSTKQIEKLSAGTVILSPEDYYIIDYNTCGLFLVHLKVFNYQYVIRLNETNLYTMNEYGSPKMITVFKLPAPLIQTDADNFMNKDQ